MATQTGIVLFEGTNGNITGYRMNGKHYLKTKSSLSRRQILKKDCFSNTRRNAKWFGEAQSIAKQIYHELPPDKRDQIKVWYPLRNKAQLMVRKELPREEIIRHLRNEFIVPLNPRTNSSAFLSPLIATRQPGNEADQLFLEKEINSGVVLSLVDQLAASRAFVQTLLSAGSGASGITNSCSLKKCANYQTSFDDEIALSYSRYSPLILG
jgi:hypothetical protein